jgi:stage III sporulation protein SpoIIIAA
VLYHLLQTTEMKIIRAIHGETLRDKIRSDQLRQLCGIQDIIKWANVRRREWVAHVERMEDNRVGKITRDNRPRGVRSRDRPKKR